MSASNLSKFTTWLGFLKPKKEKEAAVKMIKDLGIKTPNENQKVAFLSGGNQQKVAVGKWLMTEAMVYLFDEPTKGVDVGAKAEIYNELKKLTAQGKSILLISSELPELLLLSDCIAIMYNVNMKGILQHDEATEERITAMASGI